MAYLVKMVNTYGDNERHSYYRKQGIYCFDFVTEYGKDMATRFETRAEAEKIVERKDYYCNMFGANDLVIVAEVKARRRAS